MITGKKQKDRIVFTDLNDIEFEINPNKFSMLKTANVDDVYQFKLHFDKSDNKYIPLQVSESSLTKNDLIKKAPSAIALVDHVNSGKELFHYVINTSLDGIIRFSQTKITPQIGDLIQIRYFRQFNKKRNKHETRTLSIELTDEVDHPFLKTITGHVSLKYKSGGQTFSYEDMYEGYSHTPSDIDLTRPDFGFIDDFYVPKYLLRKHGIEKDTKIKAEVLFNGDKWSVFKLEVLA